MVILASGWKGAIFERPEHLEFGLRATLRGNGILLPFRGNL